MRRGRRRSAALAALLLFSGCSVTQEIANVEPVTTGESYQAQYRLMSVGAAPIATGTSAGANAERCTSPAGAVSETAALRAVPRDVEILSIGDLLDVSLSEDATFSGKYRVSQDGTLRVVHLPPVRALGRTVDAVQADLARALVAAGNYPTAPQVSVRLMGYAAARVFVSGAVFEPGAHEIGGPTATRTEADRLAAIGAAGDERRLSRALRAAGGVRPDADLSRVTVLRGERRLTFDLRPAVLGRAHTDAILLAGDQIDVPSRGCFQEALMKPSPISPPGVKVFLSNLTVPATSNAQSLNGKEARELRWGTRFLQAAVGMNCVGGTRLTNADRTVVLFTRNPITGSSIVVERNLESLLRRADRDEYDPWILPEDALACYDSGSTNVFDVARQLGVVLSTVKTN
ncbi:polysaccharide biosynthesis/export family protein [Pinisolibacter aquiterrae]|uniref:polysaccharide biosynthesis/export family protein n=1 Tax=Pinisolibacter aquiterrae TaxID=2815579 RepID=UPI001C3D6857|nr:polysaccharide biosynthesis/export family protein [Pinisolibacter aquiterrae]MBV5264746.1 polysaccharide biosynthesis/export family protein [Pinisolibacter aquiterrae]MCC8237083.1 polysaccharide biosynthesis/export family protein [Pinisolibacter aquiterrae]